MARQNGLYIAQVTDIHVGCNTLNGNAARQYLPMALEEIAGLEPQPRCILATADLVCAGRRAELQEYLGLSAACRLPIVAIPANHDLWGEPGDLAWQDLLGASRHSLDVDDLRVILFQECQRCGHGDWEARVSPDTLAWLEAQLAAVPAGHALVGIHTPPLAEGTDWHDRWHGTNAAEFLDLLRRFRVQALVTGHWHRLGEWRANGVRVINSGALTGWQWTGIPPYLSFPVRPGYTMLHWDGQKLRWSWRELCWQEVRAPVQCSLVWIGPVHAGGPRPQVTPADVFGPVPLTVHTWVRKGAVSAVEWGVGDGRWYPMTQGFSGLWQEWTGLFDPGVTGPGERVLSVRALNGGKPCAYDAVPVTVAEAPAPPPATALPRPERVFELFYTPR